MRVRGRSVLFKRRRRIRVIRTFSAIYNIHVLSRISCTHVASGHRPRINSHAIGLPIESFNDAMTDITLALESVYIYRAQ